MKRLTKEVNGVVVYIGTDNLYPENGLTAAELKNDQIRQLLEKLFWYEEMEEDHEADYIIELQQEALAATMMKDDLLPF